MLSVIKRPSQKVKLKVRATIKYSIPITIDFIILVALLTIDLTLPTINAISQL